MAEGEKEGDGDLINNGRFYGVSDTEARGEGEAVATTILRIQFWKGLLDGGWIVGLLDDGWIVGLLDDGLNDGLLDVE
jgi:hypothetical protein